MSNRATSKVLEPYAQALLSLGQSSNLLDQFNTDIALILETVKGSPDLIQFLENPFTESTAKKTVLKQIFAGKIGAMVENFLMLLVDRRRSTLIAGICEQYQVLVRKLNQSVLAEVTSTVSLTDSQKQSIAQQVKALVGAQSVDIVTTIDPDLLGGVIIKVGSKVIDASLRNQLRQISYRLAGVT